jgi:acyl-CoA thioesterase-1
MVNERGGARRLGRVLGALAARCPRLRPLLPAAVIAVSWSACHVGEGPLVAFLGDSLTSGWRLSEDEAWPALVGRSLAAGHRPIRVLNAGVSGDTVAQGLARLPGVLAHHPDVLVVALGVNDGLRGLPLEDVESGLGRILEEGRAAGSRLLLVGIRLPDRGGDAARTRRFNQIFAQLAAEQKVTLVPDLLAGVAGHPELLFRDGLHPNAAGHLRLAETVRPRLALVLAELERRSAATPGPTG